MVLHIGDSITYANQYGQWARGVVGKTTEDDTVLTWCRATDPFPGSPSAAEKSGFYLCAEDVEATLPAVANRSLTASSGIDTAEFLAGAANGGANAMPSTATLATAQTYLLDGTTYERSLHLTTVGTAFADAQFAVVMLGTNDVLGGRTAGAFIADLTSVVDVLEGLGIVVILSTLPPCGLADVTAHNAAIRTFASNRGLPLIDYYEEILARRGGVSWQGTLISGDNIHPTGAASSADPYTLGGNPATHQTGTNATNDGYLLRGWLTVQKLKEVKSYVVDNVAPPVGGGGGGGGGGGAPAAAPRTDSDNENGEGCSCGTVRSVPWQAVGLLGLFLLGFRRR